MNGLTKMFTCKYEPKMAIILYKAQDEVEQSLYLEKRTISKGKMKAGSPLTQRCIDSIMSSLAKFNDDVDFGLHGKLPKNLLYCDTRAGSFKLVWYNKPEKRTVYFNTQLGIPDGEMNVPGLLYVVENENLAMYAFKGNKPKRKLYRAPFMNVDISHVCLGNATVAKPSKNTYENIISYWENLFWKSEFSHILGDNPVKGNLSSITKECIKTGCEFPTEELIPIKKTLSDFLI